MTDRPPLDYSFCSPVRVGREHKTREVVAAATTAPVKRTQPKPPQPTLQDLLMRAQQNQRPQDIMLAQQNGLRNIFGNQIGAMIPQPRPATRSLFGQLFGGTI